MTSPLGLPIAPVHHATRTQSAQQKQNKKNAFSEAPELAFIRHHPYGGEAADRHRLNAFRGTRAALETNNKKTKNVFVVREIVAVAVSDDLNHAGMRTLCAGPLGITLGRPIATGKWMVKRASKMNRGPYDDARASISSGHKSIPQRSLNPRGDFRRCRGRPSRAAPCIDERNRRDC